MFYLELLPFVRYCLNVLIVPSKTQTNKVGNPNLKNQMHFVELELQFVVAELFYSKTEFHTQLGLI